jgi:hypothetical protein
MAHQVVRECRTGHAKCSNLNVTLLSPEETLVVLSL